VEISQALSRLKARLEPVSDTASLDAQVLLAHVVGRPRSWVMAHPEAALSPEQQADLEELASRLETGAPLPYVLGHWEFFGLDFLVTPAVLIPRPETELLVDQAIKWLQLHPVRRRVAEVGTGSGCIAISLARNLPGLRLLASDLSWPALQVARTNARRHHVAGQVDFILCDLLPGASASCDLICANLP
jgi:release factor glutamine methyltransferase